MSDVAATYHRFSFRVKDGYLVELRESRGGKYCGRTFSVKTSGRMITKDRPWGSHETISDSAESLRIAMSLWGNVSRFAESEDGENLRARLVESSSLSLTTERGQPEHAAGRLLLLLEGDDAMRLARAVAASTRWSGAATSLPFMSGCLTHTHSEASRSHST